MAFAQVTRPDWRKLGLTATAMGLNAGAVALLSLTDLGPRARSIRNQPMIVYLDEVWPGLTRSPQPAPDRASGSAPSPIARTATTVPLDDSSAPQVAAPVAPSPASGAETEAIDARWRVAPGALGPSSGTLSCNAPHLLAPDARRRCDDRWVGRANVRAIAGTGNAERDAVFARHGARRLAAWEAQRAMPARGDQPCERPNPMSGCDGVNIQVELFSSQDGFLPNLRKRRE